jgi:hypothetical protein
MTMKIAQTLLVISLATAGGTAFAATTSTFPAEALNQTPLSSEFPNMDTYKKEHRDSAVNQAPMRMPSGRPDNYSQTDVFPNVATYAAQHSDGAAQASNTSAFPEDLSPEPSMADEGLVPGIAGVAPYVDDNGQSAVGATR